MKPYVVAIDGPAASGKSSAAQRVAIALGIPYINTGNMYRAVTFAALSARILPPADSDTLEILLSQTTLEYRQTDSGYQLFLNGTRCGAEIRTPEVTSFVSAVAAVPEVRNWLMSRQRSIAESLSVVMEGRDIGTVVFPNAKFKFFLTATPRVRAERRLAQEGETIPGATVDSVAAEIAARDQLDSTRAVAPLCKAPDAILIDSSQLTLDQTVSAILKHIPSIDL